MTSLTQVSEFRLKLYSQKFSEMRSFYHEILEYPIIKEWDRGEDDQGVMFDVGGTVLEVLSGEEEISEIRGVDVSWEVSDVHGLFERLKNKTTIIEEIHHNPWGDTSFTISDPQGFHITFFTKDKE